MRAALCCAALNRCCHCAAACLLSFVPDLCPPTAPPQLPHVLPLNPQAAWKPKPVSLNVPAHTKPVRIVLEGTPLMKGMLALTGCRCGGGVRGSGGGVWGGQGGGGRVAVFGEGCVVRGADKGLTKLRLWKPQTRLDPRAP